MTLDQAITRAETKATRMEILARVERGDGNQHLADHLARDAEAIRFLVAHARETNPLRDGLASPIERAGGDPTPTSAGAREFGASA